MRQNLHFSFILLNWKSNCWMNLASIYWCGHIVGFICFNISLLSDCWVNFGSNYWCCHIVGLNLPWKKLWCCCWVNFRPYCQWLIMPLCGPILQAEICQIFGLDEITRKGRVWQKISKESLMLVFNSKISNKT